MLPFAARSLLTSWSLALPSLALLLFLPAASAQTSVQIHQIMTNLPNSPYLGQSVSVTGIVAGVLSTGGFYLTARPADYDNDPSTAEGIPILAANFCAVVGNLVTVDGIVTNVASNAINSPGTNTPGTGIMPTGCGVYGFASSASTVTLPTAAAAFGQLLPLTGMPVANTLFSAISPTGGTLDEPNETVTSNGQFWAVVGAPPANNHLFRTSGIAPDEATPPGAPGGIPTWSGNPRRLFIDSTTFGGPPIDIAAGQSITCANSGPNAPGIGLIDYTLGYNRLLLFKSTVCTVSGAIAPSVAAPADALHFHVGSLNLSRFYNTLGNNVGAVAITPAAYARRLNKAALAIVNYLGRPDIVALEEVQDLATLTDIAIAVNTMAGTSYAPYLAVGNDPNSLNLGFLVSTRTVVVDSVVQQSQSLTYTTTAGSTAPLWERPPLVLNAEFIRTGENYKLSIFNIQVTPRLGDLIGDPVLGPNIRLQRGLQALDLSRLTQQYQNAGSNLLIAGNFNAYSFNDGYVDVSGIVLGTPPAANAVVLYEPTGTTQPLYNFESSIANTTKYNIIESGNARSIEHQFVSQVGTATAAAPLSTYAAAITQPHFTTDFPAVLMNDPTTPAGLTPHDGFVSSFLLPPVPTTAQSSSSALNFGSLYLSQTSAPQTVTITNTTTFNSIVTVQSIALAGTNPGDFTETSNCTTLARNQSCTVTLTFAPLATGARSATLTVTTDSPNNPTLVTNLTGTGLQTAATLLPGNISFPTTVVGSSSTVQAVVFTNPNPVPLTIASVTSTAEFPIASTTCTGTIAPRATCVVDITFSPNTAGARTGLLTVSSSSTADPALTALFSGTAVGALSASPAALAFGAIDLGAASAPVSVALTNNTTAPLALVSLTIQGDYTFTTNCPGILAGFASCTLAVTFKPSTLGVRPGLLAIATGFTIRDPSISVPLSGSGGDFSITLDSTAGHTIAGDGLLINPSFAPLGGFVHYVHVSCTTNAPGSTCKPFQSAGVVAGSPPFVDPVAITTTAQYAVIGYEGIGSTGHLWTLLLALAAGAGLFPLRHGRRRFIRLAVLLLALGALALASGCSGKLPARNLNPTLPGTYTYTITGTDGFLTHTATYSLDVTVR